MNMIPVTLSHKLVITLLVLLLSLITTIFARSTTPQLLYPRFPSYKLRTLPSPELLLNRADHHAHNRKHDNNNIPSYETRYYTQILDHFNFRPESYQTFQHRYLINTTFWGGGGGGAHGEYDDGGAARPRPIFVYMGNEGDIEWFASNTGFMHEIAPRFRALLVFIEHRYYGKSIPYEGDKEVAYSNASTQGYLSSAQALADYATLIVDLKRNLSAMDAPVVVFGGSYGGMLAAWFRLKYPHVAIGALASSSPILSFGNLTSPYSFNGIITRDFRSESENCYKVIKESWQQIADAAKTHEGMDHLRASFHICKSNSISADSITNWLSTAYVYTAMTDYPTPSNFINPLPAYPVKQMCRAIDDPNLKNDTFAKLYRAVSIYYNHTGNVRDCFNLEDASIDKHGENEWTWQACTEMILQTGGNNRESMFPESKDDYTSQAAFCKSLYGIQPRPHWILTEFGGYDIKRVLKRHGSNIIFFNGFRDPWSGGGVCTSISDSIVAIVAENGAHHVDLRYSTKEDPQWLTDVRKTEIDIIQKWLSDYYDDLDLYSSNNQV